MKDIKIVVDGPLSRDVKLVELDGLDITGMVRELNFNANIHDVSEVRLELIGNIILTINDPVKEFESSYKEMQDE